MGWRYSDRTKEKPMPAGPDYLRRRASTCLALAEASSRPEVAGRLRFMAADFMAKADELLTERGQRPARPVMLEDAAETD